ncbi:MAG: hypothetical protein COA69_10590 [Robiginitomaculum sp.]|nr:MAG: hypothetical protein COA69_10590 [Robiginitomaculum sp.]
MKNSIYTISALALLLSLASLGTHAQAQNQTHELQKDSPTDEIVTYGQRYLKAESQISTIADEQAVLPGASNFLDLDKDIIGSERTLDTVLSFEPGVIMQPFFSSNDQVRINIRGSGIQDNPVNRGLMLLFEGMPLNQADGSFIIGLIDPSQARFITVFRGANGTSWGGTTLGGALNMTARTGYNSTNSVRLSGGTNNTFDGRIKLAHVSGDWDFSLNGGYSTSDGHRTFNTSERTNIMANAGYSFNAQLETRFYLNYSDTVFDIPFVTQKDIALNNRAAVIGDGVAGAYAPPGSLPPAAIGLFNILGGWDGVFNINNRRPSRNTQQIRFANKTRYSTDNSRHEIGLSYEDVDDTFKDPLSHTVVDAKTWSANYRFDHTSPLITANDQIQFSVVTYGGTMPRQLYTNNAANGEREFQFADLDLKAFNLAVGGQWTSALTDQFDLYIGAQYFHSDRDISGTASTPPPPPDPIMVTLDQEFSYDAFNPKLGLIYHPSDTIRLFANVSRSAETPTFNHLLPTTVGAFAGLTCPAPLCNAPLFAGVRVQDVDKQTATTFELGADGRSENFSWEASYYYSDVDDELITLVTGFAVNAQTTNYTHTTIHQGLELGLNGVLARGVFREGDSLTTRFVYNYSDFKFDGGVFNGNQIAGVPKHLLRGELAWNIGDIFTIAPNFTWQPEKTPTDHSNIQFQDDFFLLGLKAEYAYKDSWKIFADLQNITSTKYATSYVIRGISAPNQPTFLSGPGFRIFVGIEKSF